MNANLKRVLPIVVVGIFALLFLVLYLVQRNSNRTDEFGANVENAAPATLLQASPTQAATTPSGVVVFCIRLDGRGDGHLPALLGGGPNSYPNGFPGGYNWGLAPNATGAEDYGVLPDGTVFAKVKFLANNMNSFAEYIGEPAWVPVRMTEATVNGEAALTYKIPNF